MVYYTILFFGLQVGNQSFPLFFCVVDSILRHSSLPVVRWPMPFRYDALARTPDIRPQLFYRATPYPRQTEPRLHHDTLFVADRTGSHLRLPYLVSILDRTVETQLMNADVYRLKSSSVGCARYSYASRSLRNSSYVMLPPYQLASYS